MTASASPFLGPVESKRAVEAIRRLRKKQDLTQTELGARIGRSVAWVSARERARGSLLRSDAEKAAAALGTDLAGLTGGAR